MTLAPAINTPAADAAAFTVDSTADLPDANLGDGHCASAAGSCTLRAAAEQAQSLGGSHVITVPPGDYSLTTPLVFNTDDLDVTIVGTTGAAEQVVISASADRHLTVSAGTVTLNSARLTDGLGTNHGGAIGISGTGTVRLEQVLVDHNEATAFGGAISVIDNGALHAVESVLEGNQAGESGGAIWTRDDAEVTLVNTTIENNVAASATGGGLDLAAGRASIHGGRITGNGAGDAGGGIAADGTDLKLVGTAIVDNRADGVMVGGGIDVSSTLQSFRLEIDSATIAANHGHGVRAQDSTSASTVTVRASSIERNSGSGILTVAEAEQVAIVGTRATGNQAGAMLGGGGYVEASLFDDNEDFGLFLAGSATVRNTTISGNRGDGSFSGGALAGGVITVSDSKEQVQILEHVTITSNQVGQPQAGAGFHPPGGLHLLGGRTELRSTVVAGNAGPQCTITDWNEPASWSSSATNLFGDESCPSGETDIVTPEALLGPLGSAPGPVPGHLPDLTSPAIDAGYEEWCPATDQLGTPRPQQINLSGCDIGAIERPTPLPPGDEPAIEDGPTPESPTPATDDQDPERLHQDDLTHGHVDETLLTEHDHPAPPAVPIQARPRFTG